MKFSLTKIATFFFVLTIFFIPFDGVGIIPLGEFSSEAYILFLLFFIGVYIVKKYREPLYVPKITWEVELLLAFIAILVFSSLINMPSILENEHPRRTGFRKLIGQLAVLFFFFPFVTVLFYDFFKRKNKSWLIIKKVLTVALYLVFIVGFFEVLTVIYKVSLADKVLGFFELIPLMDITRNTWAQRISSFTREPPSLGMFLITTLPWILAYKSKKHKLSGFFFPLLAIVFLTFYSGSRSGMAIVLLQFVVYFFLEFSHKISAKKLLRFFQVSMVVLLLIPIVFLSVKDTDIIESKLESFAFLENYQANTSNKTRLGTYVASFETIKKNPVFGVGYGQAGFYVLEDYPSWAAKDNPEIERYRGGERFPPMFNIYLRILTETGTIGLLFFLGFMGFLLLRSLHWYYKGPEQFKKHYMVLVLSVIGFAVTWIQFDTFRVLGFWVFFSFYLYIQNKPLKDE